MKDNEFWQQAFLAILARENPAPIRVIAKLADLSVKEFNARFDNDTDFEVIPE